LEVRFGWGQGSLSWHQDHLEESSDPRVGMSVMVDTGMEEAVLEIVAVGG